MDVRVYLKSLLLNFLRGEIGFNEPDLSKVFTEYLNHGHSGIVLSAKSTQSRRKWMGTFDPPSAAQRKYAELGDILLFLFRGDDVKFSFWQAKLEKKGKASYKNNHKSFSGNAFQHGLMSGIDDVYLFDSPKPFAAIKNPKSHSITDYLIFYRKTMRIRGSSAKYYGYDADLSSVRGNTDLGPAGKTHVDNRDYCPITIHNNTISSASGINPFDTLFAQGLDGITFAMANFAIGEPLDQDSFDALKGFLPSSVAEAIKPGHAHGALQELMDREIDYDGPTMIIADSSMIDNAWDPFGNEADLAEQIGRLLERFD